MMLLSAAEDGTFEAPNARQLPPLHARSRHSAVSMLNVAKEKAARSAIGQVAASGHLVLANYSGPVD